MMLRASIAAAASVVALLSPGAAFAAGLAPLKSCYIAPPRGTPETVELSGSGFTPNSSVDVYVDGVLVDDNIFVEEDGTFGGGGVPAPREEKGQRSFTVTVTERGNPANTATQSSRVTAFFVRVRPATGPPGGRARFSGRGFTASGPLYAHYTRRGELRRTVRLAKLAGPCGRFHVKRPRIPLPHPEPGRWTIQFDQRRHYRREPANAPWYLRELRVYRTAD